MNSKSSDRKPISDWYSDSCEKLLGRIPDADELRTINRIKDVLGIEPNDALWAVLIALQYYNSLYEAIPGQISKATDVAMDRARSMADATMEAAAADAQAKMAGAVAKIANDVAKSVAGKQKARWVSIAVIVIAFALGGVGSLGWVLGYRGGRLAGYQHDLDIKAAASWANTEQGIEAYESSRSGYLDILLKCNRPGWEIKGGYCLPKADRTGGIYGWKIPTK
jgi:hypothetical protein